MREFLATYATYLDSVIKNILTAVLRHEERIDILNARIDALYEWAESSGAHLQRPRSAFKNSSVPYNFLRMSEVLEQLKNKSKQKRKR
jgi:hypothetical protein